MPYECVDQERDLNTFAVIYLHFLPMAVNKTYGVVRGFANWAAYNPPFQP